MAGAGTVVGQISIKVTPDTSKFRQELKAQLEAIERAVKCKIDVEPDLGGFRSKVNAATKGLKAEVDVDVKRGALDRITTALSKIKAPSFGSGINPAGYAAIFAGITAVAAPLFGLLTTALLTLPGLIAAIATPIAAITLGLDGLKKAAGTLAVPFEALKETMSIANEKAFTPVFEKLAQIFPTLNASLPKVSQGLADMAQAFVDSVTSSGGLAKIEATISNIGAAISKAAPGIGAFTDGLLSLAQSFSAKLPDLSDWFNDTGKSFSDWVKKITDDGSLSKAFDGLGATLKVLLDAVGGMLSSGFEFMKDPKNIEDFNAGLKSIGDSLTSIVNLSNQLNNLGDLFKGLVPTFDMTALTEDLFKPFTSENAPWRTMWADFQTQASAAFNFVSIGAQMLWTSISTGATAAVALLGTAWQGVQTSVATAFAGVISTVQTVMSQVSSLFQSVPAAFSSAWSSLAGIASSAWQGVVSAVQSALAQAVSAVVTGAGQIVAEVSALPGKIQGALGNLGGLLVGAGKALMDGLLSGIKAGAQAVFDFVSGIAGKIAALKGPLPYDKRVLTPNGEALMLGLQEGIQSGANDIYTLVKTIATAIAEAFRDVFGQVGQMAIAPNLSSMNTQMQSIAGSADQFSTSMNAAVPALTQGTGKIDSETRAQLDQLDIAKSQLALQIQQLQAQKNLAGDKGTKSALQQRIDELQIQKQQITATQQQMEYQAKYNGTVANTTDQYGDLLKQTAAMPLDFAKSTVGQFASDLGIGGNGAISQAVQQGLGFAEQFVFNVSSMDDALGGQQRIQNKKALQYTQR